MSTSERGELGCSGPVPRRTLVQLNAGTAHASSDGPMRAMSEDSPRSDAALVTAYRSGDQSAATELVHRHGGALGRYLYSLGAAASDIEDLVQEAFFRAFRALSTWREEATFRSWLFRIGSNLRKDQYRREGGRVILSIEEHDLPDRADPEGEAGRLIQTIGGGIAVSPNDPVRLEQVIADALLRRSLAVPPQNRAALEVFERPALARRLAAVLDSVTHSSVTHNSVIHR